MLLIRDEQMRVFAEDATRRFAERLCVSLRSQFPEHCAALGPHGLEAEVQHGIAAARSFGFVSSTDICRFLNLQIVLGRDFRLRPENAWAAAWLDPFDELSPSARMQGLYEEAVFRARNPGHPDDEPEEDAPDGLEADEEVGRAR